MRGGYANLQYRSLAFIMKKDFGFCDCLWGGEGGSDRADISVLEFRGCGYVK